MNYYEILGVQRDADAQTIKQSYRRLASKHHPDKGGDAAEFQRIQEAYEVLSDPERRAEYDNPRPTYRNFSGFSDFSHQQFEDIFNHSFGFRPEARMRKNPNAVSDIAISLEQAYTGTDVVVDLGYTSEVIHIQQGVQNGTKLRIPQKGPRRFKDVPPGDLIIRVHIQQQEHIQRNGNDIYRIFDIDALDAITGTDIILELLDKKKIKVKVPPGSNSGAKLKIPGKGMPHYKNPQQYGDFYVVININIPKITNPEHINLLNKIKDEVRNEQK